VSTCLDRSLIPPFGLFGGSDGAPNVMQLRRAGSSDWEPLNSRQSNMPLKEGDVVRVETAIGGGFGDPLERSPEAVAEDVVDGYITREDAESIYGVVLGDDLELDAEATGARRRELGAAGDRAAVTANGEIEPRIPVFEAAT
jgi:N-methylhydantoinase B